MAERAGSAPSPAGDVGFQRQLRAAQRGDDRAHRWLWDSFAGPVAGFLRARGTPEVDEIVNDVFLAAFRQLATFSGDVNEFRAWLFAMARNKRVDKLRWFGRRTVPDVPGPVPVEAAEEAALRLIDDDELLGILGTLTPDQRDVIVLRFVAELSLEQTAAAVGKPVGAVKAAQHRALAQLRKKFRADPYPEVTTPTMVGRDARA